jgi:hypothetical protein
MTSVRVFGDKYKAKPEDLDKPLRAVIEATKD